MNQLDRRDVLKATVAGGLTALGASEAAASTGAAGESEVISTDIRYTNSIEHDGHIAIGTASGQPGFLFPEKAELRPYIFTLGVFAKMQNKQLKVHYRVFENNAYKGVTRVEVV